jgi:hypothetical protein
MIYTKFITIKPNLRLPVKDKLTTIKKFYCVAISQSSLITYSDADLDKDAAINKKQR